MAAVVSKCQKRLKVFGAGCLLLVITVLIVFVSRKWDIRASCGPSDPYQDESSENIKDQSVPVGFTSQILSFFSLWTSTDKIQPKLNNKVEAACTKTFTETVWEILKTHLVRDLLSAIAESMVFVKDAASVCTSVIWTLTFPSFISMAASLASLCLMVMMIHRKSLNTQNKMKVDLLSEASDSVHDTSFDCDNQIYCDKYSPGIIHRFNNNNCRKGLLNQCSTMTLKSWPGGCFCFLLLSAISISIPWEFLRLYQKAVAERASHILLGTPPECSPSTMSLYQSLKSLLRSHFSWTHGDDACQSYHYALLVDPLWEVTPLMVLSSVFTRCLLHPLELTCSSLGRSLRAFFSEIPVQWQPLIMVVAMVTALMLILMLFRYRLSIPMIFRIEPKSPAHCSAQDKITGRTLNNTSEEVKRGCSCAEKFFSSSKSITGRSDDLYTPVTIRSSHQPMDNFSDTSPYLHRNATKRSGALGEINGENISTRNGLCAFNANETLDFRCLQNRTPISQSYLATSRASVSDWKKEKYESVLKGGISERCKKASVTKVNSMNSENTFPKQTVRKLKKTKTSKTVSRKKNVDMLWTPKGEIIVVSDSD